MLHPTIVGPAPGRPCSGFQLGRYWEWQFELPFPKRAASDPKRSLALAEFYARRGQIDQAIDLAVSLAGPVDYVLDTRGAVRLAAGNFKQAEEEFRVAIESAPRVDRYFHLAQALLAQGRIAEARAAFEETRKVGNAIDAIYPMERPVFESLDKQLAGSKK